MILEDKVILITGVGPGLGGEIARGALRDGARLLIAARNEERLAAFARELDPSGERVAWCAADIGDDAACARLVESAKARFGGLDGLAQVAALDNSHGGLLNSDLDEWRRVLEMNVLGPARVVRALVPALRERGGGSVVLIGSQASFLPALPQIGYASSKGALSRAMVHIARELGPERIRCNMVVPTWMWGPPVERYVKYMAKTRGVPEEAVVGEITRNMPLGVIPRDEDVAEAVLFLLSDRARMITGQHLLVNAGEWMP